MSYILEALKKADQERGIGVVPDLTTRHEARHSRPRTFRWLWIVVPLLTVNVALLVALLNDRDTKVPVTAQAPPEQGPPPINSQWVQPVQQTSEVAKGEQPITEETVLAGTARQQSSGELVVLPEPANLPNSGPLSPPIEESAQQPEAMATATMVADLPSWYELPPEFRNRLTLPRLDLHVYSEEPQNRFILVSLKKYREGERLESGLLLEEILPDGMVMSFRGERFLVEK
jgi:general secretion pathway protein B